MSLFSGQVLAETIIHNIIPGSLHRGGTITIKVIEERQEDFDAEVSYTIIPKPLVPIPAKYRKGSFLATLPIEYLDERGYEDLRGQIHVQNGAKLEHLGRKNIQGFAQTHHVRLIPSSNKWKLEAWYHPSVKSTGWAQLMMEFENSWVGTYQVYSKLK